VVGQAELLETLRRAMEYLAPGQGKNMVQGLRRSSRTPTSSAGAARDHDLLSSLAFKVLENAISVIFLHRVRSAGGTSWFRCCLPLGYIVFIGTALFFATLALAELIAIGEERLLILGHAWSLGGFSAPRALPRRRHRARS
jgi:hypothetical protein